jgi:hypothetical protein
VSVLSGRGLIRAWKSYGSRERRYARPTSS